MLRWTRAALVAATVLPVCGAAAEEKDRALRRWAIVADKPIQEDGLPDLLTARLAGAPGVELVERDQLLLATRELELTSLSAGAGAGERLKLGRLLNADGLLLLSKEEAEGKPLLKIVMSDCRYGARLSVDMLPYDPVQIADAVPRVEALFARVRERFADGIQQLVGVPHFVSRSLTHDYDNLQAGYAYLVEAALTAHPGVSVIETEEARAISRELALTPDEQQRRNALVLLEAEYLVRRAGVDDPPQVELTLRTRSGGEVRELPPRVFSLEEAAGYLSREFPASLLESSPEDAKPADTAEQFDWLVERADAFTQLGQWRHSTGLREAALLLRPNDIEQRKTLIQDYLRIATRRPHDVPLEDRKPGNTNLERAVRERVEAYLAALGHFERLIRNGRISTDEAVQRFRDLRAYHLIRAMPNHISTVDGVYWRAGQEWLVLAEEAEERFLTDVYPHVIAMAPDDERRKRALLNAWQGPLIEAALHRVDRTYRTREDLEFLERILTQVVPDGLEIPFPLSQANSLVEHQPPVPLPPEAITAEDWRAFLERLAASEHRVAAVFARCCMAREQWEDRSRTLEESRQLLAELESALRAYQVLGDAGGSYRSRKDEWMYGRTRDARDYLAREIAKAENPLPAKVATARPAGAMRLPRRENDLDNATGRLAFHPLDIHVKGADGKTQPLKSQRWRTYGGWGALSDVTACGDGLDVWWNAGALYAMREAGVLENIAADPQPIFTDVKWDGRRIWVATRRAGLWVIDPETLQVVAKIGETDGLPPSDYMLMVHPLGPGRVCAIGSFGEHKRAWCAAASWTGGGAAGVKVFHEATHVPSVEPPRDLPPSESDIHTVFQPAWLHEYDAGDDRRYLLVGRHAPTLEARMRPLLIDLETLAVHSFGQELYHADHRYSTSYYSRDGHLLEASEFHIIHRPPPDQTFAGGESWRHLCRDANRAGLINKQILLHDGWLYVPGSCWHRLHPETFEAEMLVPGRLPNEYAMRRFSVSAHYGLLAWGGTSGAAAGTYLQVTVDEPPAGQAPAATPESPAR
ncbi:MAG: hypothetical protein KY475_03210 [Planctomycetes bacterium]|nr:hypothetical protein [Planctomycetota bacterium]